VWHGAGFVAQVHRSRPIMGSLKSPCRTILLLVNRNRGSKLKSLFMVAILNKEKLEKNLTNALSFPFNTNCARL